MLSIAAVAVTRAAVIDVIASVIENLSSFTEP